MKIKSLLENFLLLLEAKLRELSKQSYDLKSNGNLFEFYCCLDKLNELFKKCDLEQEATPENLQPFTKFLSDHWKFVSRYSVNIFQSTLFCLQLAEALAKILPLSRFQLLMPTVDWTPSIITTSDYTDTDFDFNHFIFGNNKEIIEIFYCLESAEQDGILKHTRLFTDYLIMGQPAAVRHLNETEKQRVLSHSYEVRDYYQQIQNLINIKYDLSHIGGHLQRLIRKLYGGSVAGTRDIAEQNARKLKAAADANEGIVDFFKFLDTLEGCHIEFDSISQKTRKPNSYYLSQKSNVWELLYLDKDNNLIEIPISDVRAFDFNWSQILKRSIRVDVKLQEILKDLSCKSLENHSEQDKTNIIKIITSYHYNTRLKDGSIKGDFYSRYDKDERYNIKYYCDCLANPYIKLLEMELSPQYCVYLIAHDLQRILDKNKDIFQHPDKIKFNMSQEKVLNAKNKLFSSLKNVNFKPVTVSQSELPEDFFLHLYGESIDFIHHHSQNFLHVFKIITNKLSNVNYFSGIAKITHTHQILFILNRLAPPVQEELLKQFITTNPETLKRCIVNPGFRPIPESIRIVARENVSLALTIFENEELFNEIPNDEIYCLALSNPGMAIKVIEDCEIYNRRTKLLDAFYYLAMMNVDICLAILKKPILAENHLRGNNLFDLIKKYGKKIEIIIISSQVMREKLYAYQNLLLFLKDANINTVLTEEFLQWLWQSELTNNELVKVISENKYCAVFLISSEEALSFIMLPHKVKYISLLPKPAIEETRETPYYRIHELAVSHIDTCLAILKNKKLKAMCGRFLLIPVIQKHDIAVLSYILNDLTLFNNLYPRLDDITDTAKRLYRLGVDIGMTLHLIADDIPFDKHCWTVEKIKKMAKCYKYAALLGHNSALKSLWKLVNQYRDVPGLLYAYFQPIKGDNHKELACSDLEMFINLLTNWDFLSQANLSFRVYAFEIGTLLIERKHSDLKLYHYISCIELQRDPAEKSCNIFSLFSHYKKRQNSSSVLQNLLIKVIRELAPITDVAKFEYSLEISLNKSNSFQELKLSWQNFLGDPSPQRDIVSIKRI
jgi:hypothetical protein